ncbi:hypothetical protein [Pannonibacter tanglangensis]|nr:hypothetical protein [Pannonibacter sp. XCT-34]
MIETTLLFLAERPALVFVGTFSALWAVCITIIVMFGGGTRRS